MIDYVEQGVGEQRRDLLNAWIGESGVLPAELARRLGVTASAVSQWQSGLVEPNVARVITIDTALAAEGVLTALWQAVGTTLAWPPRRLWAHNFRRPGEPAWVWIRSSARHPIRARFRWGAALAGAIDVQPGMGGHIGLAPSSVDNPPVEVEFDDPGGWADFGHGAFPMSIIELGIHARLMEHLEILDEGRIEEGPIRDPALERKLGSGLGYARSLLGQHGIPWSIVANNLHAFVPSRMVHDHSNATLPSGLLTRPDGTLEVQFRIDGQRLAGLRNSLGHTQKSAAESISALDSRHPVTREVIRGIESGARGDRQGLVWRIDTTYHADGQIGLDRVPIHRTQTWRVAFPNSWIGPVWIQVLDSTKDDFVEFVWGEWRRRQSLSSGGVLAFRKSAVNQPSLSVSAPPSVRIAAGTGAVPGAIDANPGWYPKNVGQSLMLLVKAIRLIGRAKPSLGSSARTLGRGSIR